MVMFNRARRRMRGGFVAGVAGVAGVAADAGVAAFNVFQSSNAFLRACILVSAHICTILV
jgi:hypothetical protein